VVVVLTRLVTTEETARGKLSGDGVEDQITDVGDVICGSLEESILGLCGDLVLLDLEEAAIFRDLLFVEGLELGSFWGNGDALEGGLTVGKENSGDVGRLSLELLVAPGQQKGKVGVVLGLMEEGGEIGWLWHVGRCDRIQVGDDGCSIGVDVRASGQSREGTFGVELEEGGLEVRAIQEIDLLGLNVDAKLSDCDLGDGSPDGVAENVESWLGHCWLIER